MPLKNSFHAAPYGTLALLPQRGSSHRGTAGRGSPRPGERARPAAPLHRTCRPPTGQRVRNETNRGSGASAEPSAGLPAALRAPPNRTSPRPARLPNRSPRPAQDTPGRAGRAQGRGPPRPAPVAPVPAAARRPPRSAGTEGGPNAPRSGPGHGRAGAGRAAAAATGPGAEGRRGESGRARTALPAPKGPAGMSGRVGQGRPLRPQTAGFMVPAAAEATQGDAAPSCPAPIPAAASGSATKRTAGGRALRRPAHARPLQPAAPRPSARLPPRAAPNKSRGKAVRVRLRGSAAAAPVASAVLFLLKGTRPPLPPRLRPPSSCAPFRGTPSPFATPSCSESRCSPRVRAGPHEGTPPPRERAPNARPLDAGRGSLPAFPESRERRARSSPGEAAPRPVPSQPLRVLFQRNVNAPGLSAAASALAARSAQIAVRGFSASSRDSRPSPFSRYPR